MVHWCWCWCCWWWWWWWEPISFYRREREKKSTLNKRPNVINNRSRTSACSEPRFSTTLFLTDFGRLIKLKRTATLQYTHCRAQPEHRQPVMPFDISHPIWSQSILFFCFSLSLSRSTRIHARTHTQKHPRIIQATLKNSEKK